jgi:F-type H+-transporting ATPase subunit alpha
MTDFFNAGQRPAIDSGQSVSRVGGAAQIGAMKPVVRSLKIELANYRELQSFAQFGSDLDASTKRILTHGSVLMNLLKQNQYEPLPVATQILYLYVVQNRFVETVPAAELKTILASFAEHVKQKLPAVMEELKTKKKFSDASLASLKEHATAFFKDRLGA